MQRNFWGHPVPEPIQLREYPAAATLARSMLSHFFSLYVESDEAVQQTVDGLTFASADRACQGLALEADLRARVLKLVAIEKIIDGFAVRARKVCGQVRPFVCGSNLLDLGCGDGRVGLCLSDGGRSVSLADIIDYRHTDCSALHFHLMADSSKLPYGDAAFDTVLLLTVLHHSSNPLSLLREAARVTRHRLILIESVFGIHSNGESDPSSLCDSFPAGVSGFYNLTDTEQLAYCAHIDWVYNRVLHTDVNMPFNYNTPAGWDREAESLDLRSMEFKVLGFDQVVVPEFHTLHVYFKE